LHRFNLQLKTATHRISNQMTFEEALQILEEEKIKRAKSYRAGIILSACVIAISAAIFSYAIVSNNFDKIVQNLPLVSGSAALIAIGTSLSPRAKSALLAGAESGDLRILGHLIEAMSLGDIHTQAISKSLALQLLPKVNESSIPLDPVQHSCLVQHLTIQDEAFKIALISALPYIGRPDTISILESLAKGEPVGSAKTTPRIQATALKVLPELRMRLAKEVIKQKIAEVDAYRELYAQPVANQLHHNIPTETTTAENSANSGNHAN